MFKDIPQELIKKIVSDRKVRIATASQSHRWFFSLYLGHYIEYPPAQFHEEFFDITEDGHIRNAVIVAFRGSAKSTIFTLSYVLWSILGKQKKKFVLILGHTMHQARTYMKSIKEELETNEILRSDLGPFREENDWQAMSLVIQRSGARITAASLEQGIRGLRHKQYRPGLIICDDVEDLESVKTLEGRNKVHEWLTGEVIPSGDANTRLIVVGNLLHEDSLIMRLKRGIDEKKFDAIFCAYPFMDDDGRVAWPGKFASPESVEAEKQKIGSEIAWQREYLLRIVPDEDRLVRPEWIQYYDELPDPKSKDFRYTATGVDLAISKSEKADYTAMVSASLYGERENLRIYIHPNPVNERLTSLEAQQRAEIISRALGNGTPTKIFVEDVGYQRSFIEMLKNIGIPAEEFQIHGQDKRARLSIVASLIQSGKILFPKVGIEALKEQLINFGFQKHDDLADAFAIVTLKMITNMSGRLYFTRVDDYPPQKPMTPQEQADYNAKLESEYERGLFDDSMAAALRNYHSDRFW